MSYHEQFDTFVKNNVGQLLTREVPTHPIDKDNVVKWVNKHSERTIGYARMVSNLFQNVSWREFLNGVQKVANELNIYSDKELYLMFPIDMHKNFEKKWTKKSNFMTTILLYHVLCHVQGIKFKDVIFGGEEQKFGADSMIVIADDCSYSGKQLDEIVENLNDVSIFLAVPYISQSARERLSERKNVIIPSSSATFYNVENIANTSNLTKRNQKRMIDFFCGKLKSLHGLYFDFKLADFISVFCTILAYGYTLDEIQHDNCEVDFDDYDVEAKIDPARSLPLISNCPIFKKKMEPTLIRDIGGELGKKMCPYPFYKYIKWNWEGCSMFKRLLRKNDKKERFEELPEVSEHDWDGLLEL